MHPVTRLVGFLLFLALASCCMAAPILTFQGTGSDSDVSFQFQSSVPLDTPGLLTTFTFNYCNAPPEENCDQVNYSAGSGVIRFVAIGSSVDIRTFEFNSFVNNGTYNTLSAGSPNSGTVTVTGSTNAAPEPVSAALTGLGMLALISRRTVMSRHRRLRIRSVDTGQQISGQP